MGNHLDLTTSRRPTLATRMRSWHTVGLALAVLLVLCSGCVRESVSPEQTVYHYKWWSWLIVAFGAVYAWTLFARHPSTWVNGAWQPWWKFRGWSAIDVVRVIAIVVVLLLSPLQLCDRLQVGKNGVEQGNFLGLRSTRTIAWTDVSRLDVKAELPGIGPVQRKEQDKKPDLVAVLKDGRTEEFQGWLVSQARPEILRRAREAGVMVIETPDPGKMPPALAPPMPPAAQPGFHRPPGFPPAQRPDGGNPFQRER